MEEVNSEIKEEHLPLFYYFERVVQKEKKKAARHPYGKRTAKSKITLNITMSKSNFS